METADNLAKVFSKSINKEIQVKTIILQLLCNQISLLDVTKASYIDLSCTTLSIRRQG